MISQRYLKEDKDYTKLAENKTNRTFKTPEIFRVIRYLKTITYPLIMDATNLNRGNLYFILNNPFVDDNEEKIYKILEMVKRKYNLRGCYRSRDE